VLLRLSKTEDPEQVTIERAILHLVSQGVRLCYTSQSLGEFWNVSPAL
jgi:hypothetical protein